MLRLFAPVKSRSLRIIALLLSMMIAGALLYSAYGGTINPLKAPYGAIAAMLFPFILILSMVWLVVTAVWFRAAAVLTALSLIASGGPILTYCPLHFFRPSVRSIEELHPRPLKVMSYNMLNLDDYSKGFCRIGAGNPTLAYVIEQNPDILVCQEGHFILSNEKNISPEQHDTIMARYPYTHFTNRGMGIMSRYPVTHVKVEHPDRWMYDVESYRVSLPSDTITIFNLHLQSLGLSRSDKALYQELTHGQPEDMATIKSALIEKLTEAFKQRALQAEIVRHAIDSVSGTVLVCGDFNDIPGCYAQRVIQGDDLRDAYRDAGLGPAITYHADRFFFRIDHILYGGRLRPLRVWSGQHPSSDHYPIIAYFELSK